MNDQSPERRAEQERVAYFKRIAKEERFSGFMAGIGVMIYIWFMWYGGGIAFIGDTLSQVLPKTFAAWTKIILVFSSVAAFFCRGFEGRWFWEDFWKKEE